MTENELNIVDYTLFRCDAQNRHTGGVAFYIHSSVKAYVVQQYVYNYVWCLTIKITQGLVRDTFTALYRGHQAKDDDLLRVFEKCCEEIVEQNVCSHIVGDFNIDFRVKRKTSQFVSFAKNFNLKQLVDMPTRTTNDSATIIDWFFTNRKNAKVQVVDNQNIADHSIIKINLCERTKKPEKKFIKITDWSRYNKNLFSDYLNEIKFEDIPMHDINLTYETIKEKLESALRPLLDTKTIRENQRVKWWNSELAMLRSKKIDSKVNWDSEKTHKNFKTYTAARNDFKYALDKAETNFLHKQLACNFNEPQKLWKTIKLIYGDSKNPTSTRFNSAMSC